MSFLFSRLPAVHRLLGEPNVAVFNSRLGSGAVKAAAGGILDDVRSAVMREAATVRPYETLVERIAARRAREEAAGLLPVLNATGILLNTNPGRAPLAAEAVAAMGDVAAGYSNLEFDLDSGSRGSRSDRVTRLLHETTDADNGLVFNNCAAAILLVLDTFVKDREVVVAIEIGGGFRLPGTTNKVDLLRSHASNFRITGFCRRCDAERSRRAGAPHRNSRRRSSPYRRAHRHRVLWTATRAHRARSGRRRHRSAGIIVGRSAIARLWTNRLLRALRVDKVTVSSAGIAVEPARCGADAFAGPSRNRRPPIAGRVKDRAVLLDLRALPGAYDEHVAAVLTHESHSAA